MNRQLGILYQEASDFFVYLHGYAPNIPDRVGLTLNSAIERVFGYLDSLSQSEDSHTVKQWLRVSFNEVKEAKKCFERNEDREGRRRLESARTYLTNAAARKPIEATFIASDSGPALDVESGFPS